MSNLTWATARFGMSAVECVSTARSAVAGVLAAYQVRHIDPRTDAKGGRDAWSPPV